MTELPQHPDSADRAARLLTAAGRHGAPVAPDFLAELRARTTAEFARTHQNPPLTPARRWQMLFVRVLVATIATAALFGSIWVTHDPRGGTPGSLTWAKPELPALADKPFVVAFARLSEERSFTAEIQDGETTRYLTGTSDGKLRFDTEPGLYSIVDRGRQWNVDEGANRAEEVKGADYFYRRDRAALNPWRLIELEPETGKELAYREEETQVDNVPIFASYFNARWENTPVSVEAQIDSLKQLPRDVTIWPRENRGAQPLFRFHLVQAGGAPDETKFKVVETLTEDGRIGKVIDIQGLVTVRPLTTTRWTPLCAPNLLLQPGDWLRTDNRGANAVTVQLAPQTKLIVGPGSLLELPKPDQLRVTSGIVQVTATEKTPVTLTGPDGGQVIVRGKELWHVAQNKLQKPPQDPLWLAGYLSQAPQETLGSLEALVDGRNVKLSVGYHKVVVDIRDQIARTTIEESFVNHTKEVLEGKFYFPLPQDASISGFGMWIGNELVEADIVEKQRAREIYETILREKRDPGLLEWNGGNIFSARVYPIPANGEKRIKITYTQVLPLVGDSFRYSYALQSDLLKQNPLRKLELAVNIHSTQPLQQIASPTHATRNQQTPHAARLEFSAQNYTPTRDFEVVTTLATRSQDLALIPHQRGEDGFFMLLMQPPNHAGKWTRPLVNDSLPLELLILADTSASMDRGSRTRQAEVIAALLAALAPQDKFNLATCDVDCHWTFEKSVAAAPEQITKARDILQRRRSMGWTNLQRGWESALKQASPGAHIIYVGDGIVTRGTTDLAGDEAAIKTAAKEKHVLGHAIAVSSSYEARILKAIASVGGGSLRNAAGEVKPTQVANDLLVEATRPALRNISVSFEGFRTAAVYPPTLANLPAGTQQVVLGRYLPEDGNRRGKVIVHGTLDGKPREFAADIDLQQAPKAGTDDDASFIPRLWARLHLDELLSQGSSQQVQDQVIALSEEYHIITPYTSLLVLETDADRERFKVKKRFQMRDGERIFQKGKDDARYALLQQQIQQAQLWRQQLRDRMLSALSSLGRDASQLQEQQLKQLEELIKADAFEGWNGRSKIRYLWSPSSAPMGGAGGGFGGLGGPGGADFSSLNEVLDPLDVFVENSNARVLLTDGAEYINGEVQTDWLYSIQEVRRSSILSSRLKGLESLEAESSAQFALLRGLKASRDMEYASDEYDGLNMFLDPAYLHGKDQLGWFKAGQGEDWDGASRYVVDGTANYFALGEDVLTRNVTLGLIPETLAFHDRRTQDFDSDFGLTSFGRGTRGWPAPSRQPLLPVPLPYYLRKRPERKIATSWPDAAVKLVRSLQIADDLQQLAGGLSLVRQDDSFSTATKELHSRQQTRQLYSKSAWLSRGDQLRETHPILAWCDEQERGNQSLAFDLALVRKSDANDLEFVPSLLNEGAGARWEEWLTTYQVTIERPGPNRVLLIAKAPTGEGDVIGGYEEYRWLIDTELRVVAEAERRYQGKIVTRTKYEKFVQIGGCWLATTAEHFDSEGQRTGLVTLQLQELTAEQFRAEWMNEHKVRSRATSFQLPLPKLADAEKRIAAGAGKVEDRLVLLARKYGRNQWDEAMEQLSAGEQQSPAKAGWNWIRLTLLEESRRHEEVKQLLLQIGDRTSRARHPAEYGIVHRLREISSRVTGGNEQIELLAHLQPLYERFVEPFDGTKEWSLEQLQSLSSAGRYDEHRDYLAQLAAKYPRDYSLQHQWLNSLRQAGDIPGAFTAIDKILQPENTKWSDYEQSSFRALNCDLLESEGRYADAAKYAREWTDTNPDSQEAYQRLISYLVLSGQEQAAFTLAEEWIEKNLPAAGRPLKDIAYRKVYAGVQLLLGQGRNIDRANLNPKYLPLLEKILLQFVATEDAHEIARLIWNESEFHATATRQRVLKTLLDRVVASAGKLPPAQLERLMEFAIGNTHAPPQMQQWKQVQAELERRWAAEKKISVRTKYRELILRVDSTTGGREHEQILRKFLAGALPAEKDDAVRQLFDYLLNQSWTAERENETLQLIDRISSTEAAEARLLAQVGVLYTWTDTLETRRRDFLNQKIDRPDKLKREQLQQKQDVNARQAREEISQRLLSTANAKGNDPLGKWFRIEHLTLEIRLERKLPQVADQLWQWLQQALDQPAVAVSAMEEDGVAYRATLGAAWQQRLLKSLLHLAARKDAQPAHVDRLRKLFEQGWQEQAARRVKDDAEEKAQPDNKPKEGKLSERIRWQQLLYELLLVRDQPQELQQTLSNFITVGDPTGHWRRLLARVSTELNKLEAGVQLLEELERADLLGADDYRSLSVWYHALDQKQKHELAQVKVYRFQQPWRLAQQVQQHLSRWQNTNGPLPEELDPQVLLMFAALLQAEDNPSYYLGETLQSFYEVTHDPRLLHTMAKAIPGHTAERIYPMLTQCWSVLTKVEHEATIDELIQGLETVRKSAKTPLDRRALDLLEVLAERRAAELQNGAQPHVLAAVAAFQRAEKREWQSGEPQLMADFLASLGVIAQPALAAEQMRLLNAMLSQTKPGSEAAFLITGAIARTHWSYDRQQQAIDLLSAACEDYRLAQGGKVTQAGLSQWFQVADWQSARGQFLAAEKTLTDRLPQVANQSLSQQVIHRRYSLYASAIRNNGLTSLGRGEPLYRTVLSASRADAAKSPDLNFLVELVNQTIEVFKAAHDAKISSASSDLVQYAQEDFSRVLVRQVNGYGNSVDRMADALHSVAGPKAGIAFLLDCADSEPVWVRYQGNNTWNRMHWRLGHWRVEAKELGELEPRLLRFVIGELKRDLATRDQRNRSIYWRHNNFGEAKADDFAAAANEVHQENANSSHHAIYIAEYFFHGLNRQDRAVEIILDAHRRKLLDDSQQIRVVQLLHEANRYAESIPLLESLVQRFPLNLTRRCELMRAYFHTKQRQALVDLRQKSHDLFHQEQRWTESVMNEFGNACLHCELYEPAVEYLKEAVAVRTKALNGRTINDGTLSELYQSQAHAHAGLKQTKEAVDAASSAIVCWSRQHDQRKTALETLRAVLRKSPDLAAYVKQLDQETNKSKQDRPIVRKMLGEVLQEQKRFAEAIAQYRAAVLLTPNDAEIHKNLIECLDANNDSAGALAQSFESLELDRRNLELWISLATRFDEAKEESEAERARTSLAEILPGETEGHSALAQERELQERWPDALEQWQKVAELRKLEPTGLLNIARVQLQMKQEEAAAATIRQIETTTWSDHAREEVQNSLPNLKEQLRE